MGATLRFGEFLLEYGIIKRHELVISLCKQELFGGKIGENLVDYGCFESQDLNDYLDLFKVSQTL